jgi:hypothetical protein
MPDREKKKAALDSQLVVLKETRRLLRKYGAKTVGDLPPEILAELTRDAEDAGVFMKVPPPGLNGTYEDTCVICLQGTDTGLALIGEGEWVIAGLEMLGVPRDEAGDTASRAFGSPLGHVPIGQDLKVVVTVCAACVEKAGHGFPRPTPLFLGEVPGVLQPPELMRPEVGA